MEFGSYWPTALPNVYVILELLLCLWNMEALIGRLPSLTFMFVLPQFCIANMTEAPESEVFFCIWFWNIYYTYILNIYYIFSFSSIHSFLRLTLTCSYFTLKKSQQISSDIYFKNLKNFLQMKSIYIYNVNEDLTQWKNEAVRFYKILHSFLPNFLLFFWNTEI